MEPQRTCRGQKGASSQNVPCVCILRHSPSSCPCIPEFPLNCHAARPLKPLHKALVLSLAHQSSICKTLPIASKYRSLTALTFAQDIYDTFSFSPRFLKSFNKAQRASSSALAEDVLNRFQRISLSGQANLYTYAYKFMTLSLTQHPLKFPSSHIESSGNLHTKQFILRARHQKEMSRQHRRPLSFTA